MGEFALPPVYITAAPPPLPAEVPDTHVLAVERPVDPLDGGFRLDCGVLAPLPPKVRLPHEEDELEPE